MFAVSARRRPDGDFLHAAGGRLAGGFLEGGADLPFHWPVGPFAEGPGQVFVDSSEGRFVFVAIALKIFLFLFLGSFARSALGVGFSPAGAAESGTSEQSGKSGRFFGLRALSAFNKAVVRCYAVALKASSVAGYYMTKYQSKAQQMPSAAMGPITAGLQRFEAEA